MSAGFWERGGGWVLAQFALLVVVGLSAVWWPGGIPSRWAALVGGVFLALGAVLGLAGARALGRWRTAFPQPRPGAPLIQHGVYGRMRHPLYTSVMMLCLGWALCWGSAAALAAALVQIPFYVAKARSEERRLRERFPGYEDYARRVPAFLPRWRRPA